MSAYVSATVRPTGRSVRVGPPWNRRASHEYDVELTPREQKAGTRTYPPSPPPLPAPHVTVWAATDDEAEDLARATLHAANERARLAAKEGSRTRVVFPTARIRVER